MFLFQVCSSINVSCSFRLKISLTKTFRNDPLRVVWIPWRGRERGEGHTSPQPSCFTRLRSRKNSHNLGVDSGEENRPAFPTVERVHISIFIIHFPPQFFETYTPYYTYTCSVFVLCFILRISIIGIAKQITFSVPVIGTSVPVIEYVLALLHSAWSSL